jgi:hypothetical protein
MARTGAHSSFTFMRYASGRGASQSSVSMQPSTRPVASLSATTDSGVAACAARSTKGMISECQWWRFNFSACVKGSSAADMVSATQPTVDSASSGVSGTNTRAEGGRGAEGAGARAAREAKKQRPAVARHSISQRVGRYQTAAPAARAARIWGSKQKAVRRYYY